MRVPDEMKKCVIFFGLRTEENGVETVKYKGTGFFVGVPVNDDGSTVAEAFLYLVTAKHVAEQVTGKEFVIRANTTDGKSILIRSPKDSPPKWFTHPTDHNADVVALQWTMPDETNVDYEVFPTRSFVKSENLKPDGIGIGSEVCIIGLFAFHGGQSKNHPMLRTGNIAMIPDEKVSTKNGEMDAYLIEARSIGGISGSPVFVTAPGSANTQVRNRWLLLGLIHGHWDLKTSAMNDAAPSNAAEESKVNLGIAIVTPAQKILEILNGEELSKVREEQLRE